MAQKKPNKRKKQKPLPQKAKQIKSSSNDRLLEGVVRGIESRNGMIEEVQEMFLGPIPPPKVLEDYEKIAPGSAEKIISMAMKEIDHRHAQEKIDQDRFHEHYISKQESDTKIITNAQQYAFIIAFLVVIASSILIYLDKSPYVLVTLLLALSTFVAISFWGKNEKLFKKSKKNEADDDKQEEEKAE